MYAKADTVIISYGLILTLTRCFFGLNPPKAASGVTVATSGPARWRRRHKVCRKEIALHGWEAFTSFLSQPQFLYLQNRDNSKPQSSYLICYNVWGNALLTLKYCIKYTFYHGNIDCFIILDYFREFRKRRTLCNYSSFLLIPLWNEALHKYINNSSSSQVQISGIFKM